MNCRTYLLQLLSRRDYSQEELRKKAVAKGFEETEIIDTLQYLQEIKVQSDAGVAESLILGYLGKYGKRKIKQKSREKGIRDDLFEQMWDQLAHQRETEDLSHLKEKVMRKYKLTQFSNLDPKTKRKVFNFLQYRGFNPFQLLQQWQTEEG